GRSPKVDETNALLGSVKTILFGVSESFVIFPTATMELEAIRLETTRVLCADQILITNKNETRETIKDFILVSRKQRYRIIQPVQIHYHIFLKYPGVVLNRRTRRQGSRRKDNRRRLIYLKRNHSSVIHHLHLVIVGPTVDLD